MINKTNWIEYTGTTEQIDEIKCVKYGVLINNPSSSILDFRGICNLQQYAC